MEKEIKSDTFIKVSEVRELLCIAAEVPLKPDVIMEINHRKIKGAKVLFL